MVTFSTQSIQKGYNRCLFFVTFSHLLNCYISTTNLIKDYKSDKSDTFSASFFSSSFFDVIIYYIDK